MVRVRPKDGRPSAKYRTKSPGAKKAAKPSQALHLAPTRAQKCQSHVVTPGRRPHNPYLETPLGKSCEPRGGEPAAFETLPRKRQRVRVNEVDSAEVAALRAKPEFGSKPCSTGSKPAADVYVQMDAARERHSQRWQAVVARIEHIEKTACDKEGEEVEWNGEYEEEESEAFEDGAVQEVPEAAAKASPKTMAKEKVAPAQEAATAAETTGAGGEVLTVPRPAPPAKLRCPISLELSPLKREYCRACSETIGKGDVRFHVEYPRGALTGAYYIHAKCFVQELFDETDPRCAGAADMFEAVKAFVDLFNQIPHAQAEQAQAALTT